MGVKDRAVNPPCVFIAPGVHNLPVIRRLPVRDQVTLGVTCVAVKFTMSSTKRWRPCLCLDRSRDTAFFWKVSVSFERLVATQMSSNVSAMSHSPHPRRHLFFVLPTSSVGRTSTGEQTTKV